MEILGQYPIEISIHDNTRLTWYLIQILATQPKPTQTDPKLINPSDPDHIANQRFPISNIFESKLLKL